jgi:hypothetical protein
MYQVSTPNIITPADETEIWRYLDVFKFVDLVLTRELFLCRLDRLGDPREGRLPESVLATDAFVQENVSTIEATVRECVCVNCWHCREDEVLQMWHEYAACGTGLAIQSTIGRLKAALTSASGEQFIGKVTYLDYKHADCSVNGRDLTAALCLKDHSFRHEQEVRVIMITDDDGTAGTRAKVDLSHLIDKVVVGPYAPGLAKTAMKRLMDRCNLDRPIVSSSLLCS